MAFRREFREALALLAKAAERLAEKGYAPPILVGGGAVELYTGGAVVSGDFDFVSGQQTAFFDELRALGFTRPDKVGWMSRALLHPGLLMAVQVVSGALMDGRADKTRVQVIELDGAKLGVIPVEDLIADRMAQALTGSRIREDMQNQSVRLYQLAEIADMDYLSRRIEEETGGEASLATLTAWVEDDAARSRKDG